MDSENLDAMAVAASELAMGHRWREAAAIAEKIVAADPSRDQMWWILGQAYTRMQHSDDARVAYAEYYRHAPKRADLQGFRQFAARMAGVPFEDATGDDEPGDPSVVFKANIDGRDIWIECRNDSGKPFDEVMKAVNTFLRLGDPFDAWACASRHQELLTSIADVVLSAVAQSQPDIRGRVVVERYRDALRAVRDGKGVAPFAAMAQISEREFQAVVSAIDDLQPAIKELADTDTDDERDAVLARYPQLLNDDRTLIFLRSLGRKQCDSGARQSLQYLLTYIRRARRGAPHLEPPPLTPAAQAALDLAGDARDPRSIDAALAAWDIAMEQTSNDSSQVARSRGRLLLHRYELLGERNDLENACRVLGDAIDNNDDLDLPPLPYYYSAALLRRFERDGNADDLDAAIAVTRYLLTLLVDGTDLDGESRSLLGMMLMRRAELTGDLADLDTAIESLRCAIFGDASCDEEVAAWLSNLGMVCMKRFDWTGSVADLDEAESAYMHARSIAPLDIRTLGGFARVCRARYSFTGDTALLDSAIEAYKTVTAWPDAPFDYALTHNNLAASLLDRYLAINAPVDLDAAIEASRVSVGPASGGHTERPRWLQTHANNLRVRFMHRGDVADRREAIAAYEEAIALAPAGTEPWRSVPANLGYLLMEDPADEERGIELLELGVARLLAGAIRADSIRACRNLAAAYARRENWPRASEVVLAGLDTIEALQRTQLSMTAKKAWLVKEGDFHIFAAEILIRAQRIGDALVALERGRSRLLAEVLGRDRSALAELERAGDHRLVERFRVAAEQVRLLSAAAERGKDVRQAIPTDHAGLIETGNAALNAVIHEVREATGEWAPSRPLTLNDISGASIHARAPLIYVVPLSAFGVAIIVRGESGELQIRELPELTVARIDEIVEQYSAAYKEFITSHGKSAQTWMAVLDETVRWCWHACMRLVVEALDGAQDAVLIPMGRLGRLPLHAASGADGSALDAATWRYAPNARSLVHLGPAISDSLLTMSFAPKEAPLRFTGLEVAAARRAFARHHHFEAHEATCAAILGHMREATVLHFACHGSAATDDSRAGGLVLADGVLSLQELFDARIAPGTTAILSACETGMIGEKLPDEVVSIASGMLQAGASAVVSSLWAVPDVSTAILMSRFYFLWQEEGRAAAPALRDAQRWMRDSNNATIAAFLGDWLGTDADPSLIVDLSRDANGAAFGHLIHWAAFTYAGA